jgi:hypothetical protein
MNVNAEQQPERPDAANWHAPCRERKVSQIRGDLQSIMFFWKSNGTRAKSSSSGMLLTRQSKLGHASALFQDAWWGRRFSALRRQAAKEMSSNGAVWRDREQRSGFVD